MGSFHDPRGHCVRKKISRTNRSNKSNRTYRTYCYGRLHQGIDVISLMADRTNASNLSVYAVRGGKIAWRGSYYGLGYIIIVEHEDHYYIIYAHLDRNVYALRQGQEIARGQKLANMGASGNARRSPYPYQVHIEVIKTPYFKYRGKKTLRWLKQLGKRTYSDGGIVPPHTIGSLQSVMPGLSDFHECPEGEMHCTCPEYHGEKWCHEFDKNIRCPL